MSTRSLRRRSIAIRTLTAAGFVVATFVPAVASISAAPATDTVRQLFDPSIVRDFRLALEPLAGWRPGTDWVAPDGWDSLTPAEQDSYIAADPQLSAQAVDAAWDTIRFDITNTIVLPASFDEVTVVDGEESVADLNGAAEGTALRVGVRRKSSRALPNETDPQKIGLKVGFGDVVRGQLFRGVSKLSLENGGDINPLHEGMAWQLHQLASVEGLYGDGYDPALASWAKVSMNGRYLGVFTSVEQRNKQFMRNRGLWTSPTTWLYKQDDIGAPELDEGPAPLSDGTPVHSPTQQALCFSPFRTTTGSWAATCPTPTDGLLDDTLDDLIDMQVWLTEAAVDAFTANNDATLTKGKNYFWIDRTGERRRYYPWDLDSVFRAPTSNIYSVGSTTNKRGAVTYTQSEWQTLILNHPVYRQRFNAIMLSLLDGPLSSASVTAFTDNVAPALTAAMATDPYLSVTVTEAAQQFADLKAWIAARAATVRAQVAANVPTPRKSDAVAPTISGLTLSSSTVAPSASFTVTATATDNAEVLSSEVRVGGNEWQSITGSFGTGTVGLSVTLAAPATDGSYPVCVRATDSSANTSSGTCTTLRVAAPTQPTSLVYSGATTARVGTTFTLSARLTSLGVGVPGQTIRFVVNRSTYTATTDVNGIASITAKAITKTGSYTIATSFAGTVGYDSSNAANTTVVITR